MKLTPYLIAINLGLAALISLGIYNHIKTESSDEIEISQEDIESPAKTVNQKGKALDAQRQNRRAQPQNPADVAAATCSTACQTRIIEHLASGVELSPADALLIEQNADQFAPLFAANTNALGALLQKLQEDEDQEGNNPAQMAAFAIDAALSGKTRITASQKLLVHPDPVFRVAGINLAANDTALDAEAARAFKALASTETNPRVLTALINAIPTQSTAATYNPDTIDALDSLISYKNSDFIRGSAIVAKSQLVQSPSEARLDVKQALEDPSNKLRVYGLRAYSIIKTRQTNSEASTELWADDEELHGLLTDIIDDPDASSEQREAAKNLIWDF